MKIPLDALRSIAFGALVVVVQCEEIVKKHQEDSFFFFLPIPGSSDRDNLWLRDAPQVIVVAPQFLFLQAVTQLKKGVTKGSVSKCIGKRKTD